MRVLLVTGMSGSGKSIVLNVLEDAGFAVVDNLPARFLIELIEEMRERGHERVAISVDVRTGSASMSELPALLSGLRRFGCEVQALFLTANAATLVQRYSETRRRHPLSIAGSTQTLEECIEEERRLLAPLESIGQTIDTSTLRAQTLRAWVRDFLAIESYGLMLLFESFAFKDGVPLDADLVFDVRCLPNPHYDPQLRALTGRDQPVIDFLRSAPMVGEMINDVAGFVARWLPAYESDNRSYLTVAIGCTGGQHRSVYCVEQLAARFHDHDSVLIRHRALDIRAVRSIPESST
jgi:UPF0042 nucleotide-binding protein